MPVLNQFGDQAYARVVQHLDAFAANLGIPKEIIRQYWSDTAHLPQTLDELKAWGMTPDREYGQVRYDAATGRWNPLGTGPTPGKTDLERGGFPHFINNNVGDAQRFQQVDEQGNIFGGSWDPAYNAAHQGQPAAGPSQMSGAGMRSAQAQPGNPFAGTPQEAAWEQANPPPGQAGTPTPQATGGGGAAAGGGTSSGLGPLIDAAAYGNTQTLQAQIDDAIRRYALARTTEERNQAYLDLQRWQTELGKAEGQQKRYDAMAQALLSAGVQLQNSPRDYFKFNAYTSGGRDIFGQMQQAGPAFAGPTGPIEPGSVNDLIQRLGIQPSQPTPATPAGVMPGAANPHNPELPYAPVPGAAGGPPGALQPGAGGVPAAASSLPAYEQMLRELDQAAGGSWGGNRTDRQAVATNWWNADPTRRGKQMPAWS